MKAQLSVEFLLVAVLVLVTSALIFKSYQITSSEMVVEANLKSIADWEIATSSLDDPVCGVTGLAGINRWSPDEYVRRYEYRTTDPVCTQRIFDSDVRGFANSSTRVVLGCDFTEPGNCRGFVVGVYG